MENKHVEKHRTFGNDEKNNSSSNVINGFRLVIFFFGSQLGKYLVSTCPFWFYRMFVYLYPFDHWKWFTQRAMSQFDLKKYRIIFFVSILSLAKKVDSQCQIETSEISHKKKMIEREWDFSSITSLNIRFHGDICSLRISMNKYRCLCECYINFERTESTNFHCDFDRNIYSSNQELMNQKEVRLSKNRHQ